jgi:hypothetical protein
MFENNKSKTIHQYAWQTQDDKIDMIKDTEYDWTIELECIYDWLMEINMTLFQRFIEELKKRGATEERIGEWEKEFDDYIKVTQQIYKEKTDGNFGLRDVEALIPHNKWIEMMKRVPVSTPDINITELRKSFQERLERKKQGVEMS